MNYLFSIILIIVGVVNLIISIRFLMDKSWAQEYIKLNPKAFLLRKVLGEERAYKLARNIFAPLGCLLGLVLIIVGLLLLFQ